MIPPNPFPTNALTISCLHNKFAESKKGCLVLGCGMSAKTYQPNPNIFTIGVNDIGMLMNPDMLFIVDHKKKFESDGKENGKARIVNIEKTVSDYYVLIDKDWNFPKEKKYFFKLGSMHNPPTNLHNTDQLDFGFDSPYMAVILALKMGFKNVGLLGVDYTPNHFYAEDGDHQLVKLRYELKLNTYYGSLLKIFKSRKIGLYNLSEISRLTALPKISYDDFLLKL